MNVLGAGFLEKVYREEASFRVLHKGRLVGEYSADIVVEDRVVAELKFVERMGSVEVARCINYLKASGLSVALLINFRKSRLELKRVVNEFDQGSQMGVRDAWSVIGGRQPIRADTVFRPPGGDGGGDSGRCRAVPTGDRRRTIWAAGGHMTGSAARSWDG